MTQKQASLNRIVQIGFTIVLTLMLINGATTYWVVGKMTENSSWVTHTYNVKASLAELLVKFVDAETGQRGFLYTQKDEFLGPYNDAQRGIQELQKTIVELVKDNPTQVQRMKGISDLSRQKLDELAETIALQKAGKAKEAMDLVSSGKGKKLMDALRMDVNEIILTENTLLEQREKDLEKNKIFVNAVMSGGSLLAIAIGIIVFVYINRNVIRKLNESITAISSSTTEIVATVDEHERTVTQQAAAVNETTSTVEELGASSRQSATQAESMAAAASQSLDATQDGVRLANQVSQSMNGMKQKVGSVADQILRLSEQAAQIGGIAKVVGELAGETNMLALNAAVEAARAGEHGKGFAVVAAEIRKLADQSKKSAERTNALVTEIQKATNSAVMVTEEGSRTADEVAAIIDKTLAAFGSISTTVSSVSVGAQQVLLNSRQQAAALAQVTEAMKSLAAGSTQMAAGTAQTKIGVQKLNSVALGLKAMV